MPRPWSSTVGVVLLLVGVCLGTASSNMLFAGEADDEYVVAAKHYAEKRWKFAAEAFQTYLRRFPEHSQAAEGAFFLGEALVQLGQHEEAGSQFRNYLRRKPQGKYARAALFRAGESAYLTGNTDRAKIELARFRTEYPDDKLNSYVLSYLGNVALKDGDADAAVRHYRQALAKFPEGRLIDEYRFGLAQALDRSGPTEEAAELYRAVAGKAGARVAESPLADDSQFHLGALRYAEGDWDKAIEAFGAFDSPQLAESRWKSQAVLGHGWALVRLGRFDDAEIEFRSLVNDREIGIEARYWLALTQKAKRQWKDAAATFLAAAAVAPRHRLQPALRFHAGDALSRSGDPRGALEQFELAATHSSGSQDAEQTRWIDDALHGAVKALVQLERHDEVVTAVDRFDKQCPQSPLRNDVQRLLARSLITEREYEEAARLLTRLVDSGVPDAQGLTDQYLLALALRGLGRSEDALRAITAVLASAQGNLRADALLTQGSLLVDLQRYADAIGPLEAFLETEPTGSVALQGAGELARCHVRVGAIAKAKEIHSKLVRSHANHQDMPLVTEQLAEAAYAAEDRQWAAELFEQLSTDSAASRHGPSEETSGPNVPPENQWKSLSGVGWSQYKGGKLVEAAATFSQLLDADPPPPLSMAAEAAMVRGEILQRLGREEAALVMYDKVITNFTKTKQHPEALLAAARLRDRMGQDEEAVALYERLATEFADFPRLDRVLYHWAWSLGDLGREEESNAKFTQVHEDHRASDLWADATFQLARRAFAARDYKQAELYIERLLAAAPEARIREQALYLRGQSEVVGVRWHRVRKTFEEFLREYPESRRRLIAEYWIAEATYRLPEYDYEEALELFENLDKKMLGRREAWLPRIALRRAQALAQLKRWDEAMAVAESISEQYPDFESQYEVDYVIGRCHSARGTFTKARDAYRRVTRSKRGSRSETAVMAQVMIGESFFHQKQYDEALREYLRVEALYDHDKHAYWQAMALLEVGKCYDELGELDSAAETYNKILKSYDATPFVDQASLLLRDISARRDPRTTVPRELETEPNRHEAKRFVPN